MLRFQPQYHETLWGGRHLEEHLGRILPPGLIGESWELVDIPGHSSVLQGSIEHLELGSLWRQGRLGGSGQGAFPFLLKWLSTQKAMSVQVHPSEEACRQMAQGDPKTEAWWVAHSGPDAKLWLGHRAGLDAAKLRQAAHDGTIEPLLEHCHPQVGQYFFVKAGTLHCIGPDLMLLEVQQPSDTTYRVYDWGRVNEAGKARQLHLEEACRVVDYARIGAPKPLDEGVQGPAFQMRSCPEGTILAAGPLRVLVAVCTEVELRAVNASENLNYGDVVVAEPSDGAIEVAQGRVILVTEAE